MAGRVGRASATRTAVPTTVPRWVRLTARRGRRAGGCRAGAAADHRLELRAVPVGDRVVGFQGRSGRAPLAGPRAASQDKAQDDEDHDRPDQIHQDPVAPQHFPSWSRHPEPPSPPAVQPPSTRLTLWENPAQARNLSEKLGIATRGCRIGDFRARDTVLSWGFESQPGRRPLSGRTGWPAPVLAGSRCPRGRGRAEHRGAGVGAPDDGRPPRRGRGRDARRPIRCHGIGHSTDDNVALASVPPDRDAATNPAAAAIPANTYAATVNACAASAIATDA